MGVDLGNVKWRAEGPVVSDGAGAGDESREDLLLLLLLLLLPLFLLFLLRKKCKKVIVKYCKVIFMYLINAPDMTVGVPAESYEEQKADKRWGPAPDYAQGKWWSCYGADEGPSAMVPAGVDKLPVENRPADVFYLHATSYFGPTWQMPPSEVRADEVAGWAMSQNASAFNGTCRIFAPRYRQATIQSFLTARPDGRAALDGAYEDVRAAFQHYLDFQNNGRPFFIAGKSPLRQPRGELMVSLVNAHTNVSRGGGHLWEIDF